MVRQAETCIHAALCHAVKCNIGDQPLSFAPGDPSQRGHRTGTEQQNLPGAGNRRVTTVGYQPWGALRPDPARADRPGR
ncbi:MAG: hypothetical protein ACOC00_06665 [Halothiobacillaceae bacterium]